MDMFKKQIEEMLSEHNKNGECFDAAKLNSMDRILFGTFGFHDEEPPHSIISRKLKEIENKNNDFGLWGVDTKIQMNDVIEFCNDIAKSKQKDVYLILKVTSSEIQKRGNSDIEIWSKDKLLKSGCFTKCKMDGKEIDLISKGIFVKGNKNQSKAFVVEDYFFYKDKITAELIRKCYNKPNQTNISFQNSCNLLIKDNKDLKEEVKKLTVQTDDDWAIVLKLKTPYIVECY